MTSSIRDPIFSAVERKPLDATNRKMNKPKMNKPKRWYRVNGRKKQSKYMQNQHEYFVKMLEKIAQIEAQLKNKAQQ